MPLMRRCVVAIGMLLGATSALGQALQVLPDAADSRLIECLQPAFDALPPLVYPPDALILKREATVRVRLEFTQPDAAPLAEIFFNRGGDEFNQPVLQRVRAYRLPCLPTDLRSPLAVTQEFHFDPRDGQPVAWGPPYAAIAGPPNACRMSVLGDRAVTYPNAALGGRLSFERKTQSGVVLALMEFGAEDQAPKVKILHDAGSAALAAEVEAQALATRLRCERYPVRAIQPFQFSIEGEAKVALKDMSLRTFAGLIKDLDRHKVYFDFTTMQCPFDVQVELYQPHFENSVGEVGARDPNRTGFLRWLRGVALKLPPDAAKHLVGAQTRVGVPCGALDLRN